MASRLLFVREMHRLGLLARARAWPQLRRDFDRWREGFRDPPQPLAGDRPWLTFDAIRYLEPRLRPDMRIFEFGAGGSTLFFARRVGEGHSVEHDPRWGEAVRGALTRQHFANWSVQVARPDAAPESNDRFDDPDAYRSSDPAHRGASFRAYASAIDRFPDETFDLVLVDGRARPSCFKHGAPKVKPGGLLILDNAERPHYHAIHSALDAAGWARHDFPGPGPFGFSFWQTTVWQRPVKRPTQR